jgi:hypothetical protein
MLTLQRQMESIRLGEEEEFLGREGIGAETGEDGGEPESSDSEADAPGGTQSEDTQAE